jgi:hypothetical protein
MIILDGNQRVAEKHYLPGNLTEKERLDRLTRRKAREVLNKPPEP